MQSKRRIVSRIVALVMVAVIGLLIWQLSGHSSATTGENKTLPAKQKPLSKTAGASTVAIQIDPALKAKGINLGSLDNIEVAVLSDANFDAKSIDPGTLNFAGASILKVKGADNGAAGENDLKVTASGAISFDTAFKDVNGDGREDLLARFSIPYLSQLSAGFNEAVLTARTVDGSAIRGSDYVNASGESVLKSTSSVTAPAAQFCNGAAITIPDSGAATPYPSTINVSGLTGLVSKVTVTLTGMNHTFPDDVDILLVSPSGKSVLLMSDTGGSLDLVNVNLTFDDAAASQLPDGTQIVSGTFKPSNYGSGDTFPAPAPASSVATPYGGTMGNFNGTNPNGDWNLFVVDDLGGDMGSISGGWCIDITTTPTGGCAPTLLTGSITGGDTTQTGRLFRNAVNGLCQAPKVCPGPNDSLVRQFDSFTVQNQSSTAQCVTVSLTSGCGTNLFLAAYLGSYDPANICTNYLADNGSSFTGTSVPMSFTLAAGATVVVVVHEITANSGCASYSLLVEGDLCAPVGGTCTLTCPANITVSTDPNLCSAVVNYPAPTFTGTCGTITCTPPSGSTFQKGTTTVNCTSATGGGTCSFTVTVNDTQAPTITCPPNSSAVLPTPGATCTTVTYCPPTVTDNCPGVTFACVPPSGSCLPPGTTTVTCTATDTSGNNASCSFTVTVFNICIQDDSDPTKVLLLITSGAQTGQYRFCCNGTTFTGTGIVKQIGSNFTFTHTPPDRRVQATFNIDTTSTASLQVPPGSTLCTIIDKPFIGVHTCICGSAGAGCN